MATVAKVAVILSQSLESILKSTFGPNGLDVMLTSSSGNILITNSGAVILKSLSVAHPVGRLIVDKIVGHCGITGDGATSFVLILAEMLRSTINSYEGRPVNRASTELDPEQRKFMITMSHKFSLLHAKTLDAFVLPILDKLALKVNVRTESRSLVKHRVICLIKTTLCGKFPSSTVCLLSGLLAELVFNTWAHSDGKTIHDTVLRLIDNFPEICIEVPGIPLTSSEVLQGILIPREFATDQHDLPSSPDDEPFKFVVLDCPLDSDDLQVNATLKLKSASALDEALTWKRTRVRQILSKLKDHGVRLILSSESLADFILHFCRQLKICVVQMIPQEYTGYICASAQINPLAEFDVYEDSIATSFFGTGVFCRRTVLGQHRYVHLGVQTDSNGASLVHSLLLCGPVQGICQQYSIAVLGALKTIRMAFDRDKHTLKFLPGGGATEVAISHELEVYSKTSADPYEALACCILRKGLLAIPRQLHLNSHTTCGKVKLIHLMLAIEKAWVDGLPQGIDGRTGSAFDPLEREIFEPFMGKYFLLSHLLQCVSQLLRTDQLVGAATSLHTTRDTKEDSIEESEA